MNEVILTGTLREDPTLKPNMQQKLAEIMVVTRRMARKKNSKEYEEVFEAIPVTVWGQQADFVCQHMRRDTGIVIKGRVTSRTYDGQNGVTRQFVGIMAETVEFAPGVGRPPTRAAMAPVRQAAGRPTAPATQQQPAEQQAEEDERPW